MPLVFRVSMGGGDCLPSDDPLARLLAYNIKQTNTLYMYDLETLVGYNCEQISGNLQRIEVRHPHASSLRVTSLLLVDSEPGADEAPTRRKWKTSLSTSTTQQRACTTWATCPPFIDERYKAIRCYKYVASLWVVEILVLLESVIGWIGKGALT
uniref:SFRICE_001513 n=1 Tax=Spodoptera frugiperda TaxID=7108 RepID=A0A2H1W8B1_SPOFR